MMPVTVQLVHEERLEVIAALCDRMSFLRAEIKDPADEETLEQDKRDLVNVESVLRKLGYPL